LKNNSTTEKAANRLQTTNLTKAKINGGFITGKKENAFKYRGKWPERGGARSGLPRQTIGLIIFCLAF